MYRTSCREGIVLSVTYINAGRGAVAENQLYPAVLGGCSSGKLVKVKFPSKRRSRFDFYFLCIYFYTSIQISYAGYKSAAVPYSEKGITSPE